MTTVSIDQLNSLSKTEFIQILGGIFEHSPWVAEKVYTEKPFDSVSTLLEKMIQIVSTASHQQQLALICNHPELAGKAAEQNALTDESKNEQAGAGLNNCSSEELQKLRLLNQQYRNRHGFPFVIAVKQLTRYDILDAIQMRLQNPTEDEFKNCIREIAKIAKFRLNQLITD